MGTLPPPRFTSGDLQPGDVDFSYGSIDGQLWPILDRIFDLNLDYKTTTQSILQRKQFLIDHKIGICDVVASAKRDKVDASDIGMRNVVLRPLIDLLKKHTQVTQLLFTGGNSKNGPEYFFRRQAKQHGIFLKVISSETPRVHEFELGGRLIRTVSLTAPSGSANRAVGGNPRYKKGKAENPSFTTIDFRVLQYAPFFRY